MRTVASDVAPERITIPYGVSFDGLLDVIGAWYRAQGYAKPMKTGEVGLQVRSGAKPESKGKVVSNQSSFLIQIGILRKVGQSSQLTELGQEVSRLVDQGLNAEFNRTMMQIILNWSQARPLLDWIRDRGTVPKKELVERIVQVSGKSMGTTNATMGASALIVLLERVGLMRAEGSSFTMSEGVAPIAEPVSARKELVVTETPKPVEEAPAIERPMEAEPLVTEPPRAVEEVVPEEKHEEAAPLITEPPRPVEEAPPEEKHEEAEPVVIELPGPVEEPTAEEKHEEVVPVVFETPQPEEEAAPEEKHEEAETVVSEAAKAVEEAAPKEEHEEVETAVTEAPQPAEEPAPAEEHAEAEPSVTEPPQPVEEAPPEEKHEEKEAVVSESREETEKKTPTETHNEPKPVVSEPSHAAGETAPTEKHETAEARRPTTGGEGRERWKYCYSGCCCCIFILLLVLILFGPSVLEWLFP